MPTASPDAAQRAESPLVRTIVDSLASHGFDLVGAAAAADYDRRVDPARSLATRAPWARSILVVGNGGGALWHRVEAWARPRGGMAAIADPIDEYTERTVTAELRPILAEAAIRAEIVFPFAHGASLADLSFFDLASAAGLGAPSLLRVLVHPVFGPWMALRAAVVTDAELRAPRPADGFDPCPGCVERACMSACPAGAIRDPGGWDLVACIDHRIDAGGCEDRCAARFDCVLGRSHRYPAEATAHHHRRAWRAMRSWREATRRTP